MSFLARCNVLCSACWLLASIVSAAEPPLHERVDALIEMAAVGPVAPPASDADFVRRIYLDLTGVIPTTAEARALLEDSAPDKRLRLIDALLESPRYARHLSLTFDVLLMERSGDKAIKTPEWQAYLKKAFAENKPLDQICRELIVSDGADEALRPASRFLLDRDCEPNLVTRDVGRLMFGMDLQCAQCHDHPAIDDYLQEDYYGLQAFFLRSSLFNDAAKKQALVAEKADGEANFKSVFTSNAADRVAPRLPHGVTAAEDPTFAKGEEYVVAPAKDVRPVPKHSRRGVLASLLKDSPEFRRNWANRFWAHLFGRGIVHPVDAHHLANSPTHPEVLALVADEFAKANFDVKWLLRELVQTRAYQRSCDPPSPETLAEISLTETLAALEHQLAESKQREQERDAAAVQAKVDLRVAREAAHKQQQTLAPLAAELAKAEETLTAANAAEKTAAEMLAKQQQQAVAVAEAATKAEAAVQLLGEDQELKQAATTIAARSTSLAAAVETARQAASELTKQTTQASGSVAAAKEALETAKMSIPTAAEVASLERTALDAQQQAQAEHFAVAALQNRIALAQATSAYQTQAQSDPALAEKTWPSLVEQWTIAGQLAPLRPLNCEQFALSLLQATGSLAQRQQAELTSLEKSPPDALKDIPETERPRMLALLVEEQAFEKVRGNVNAFVALYATGPDADFQATVNQALFFENGSAVQSLLGASGGNLTERLVQQSDGGQLAEELYLSTLSRLPTEEERQDVAQYLEGRTADRAAAVAELVWALLSSNEFRFNH